MFVKDSAITEWRVTELGDGCGKDGGEAVQEKGKAAQQLVGCGYEFLVYWKAELSFCTDDDVWEVELLGTFVHL